MDKIAKLKYTSYIDDKLWIAGEGQPTAKTMLIFENPHPGDIENKGVLYDEYWDIFKQILEEIKPDISDLYITYAVKFLPANYKKPKISEFNTCSEILLNEIKELDPDTIIIFGSNCLKLFLGTSAKISKYEGTGVYSSVINKTIYPINNPSYILRYPEMRSYYINRLKVLLNSKKDNELTKVSYTVIDTLHDAEKYLGDIDLSNPVDIAVDCEWEGEKDMIGSYIRTIQVGFRDKTALIFKLHHCAEDYISIPGGRMCVKKPVFTDTELEKLIKLLNTFFTHPNVNIYGHNIIADGLKLLRTFNIDIRNNVVYDTMLAEHAINSAGPFGLEMLTCKYTTYGRYDRDLLQWIDDNTKIHSTVGYGDIPDEILFPYGALDVITIFPIMEAQLDNLARCLKPRGDYPSLFKTYMDVSYVLYELELTGMKVDIDRLDILTDVYHTALNRIDTQLKEEALRLSNGEVVDFNPNSVPQCQHMLYDVLNLTPVKTTGKPTKQWSWVLEQPESIRRKYKPSTDKETLEVLALNNEFAALLLKHTKINIVCKNFLRNEQDTTKGIRGNMWRDNRLHANFSQLAETGRFKHRNPNVANFPKAAEGDLNDIIYTVYPDVKNIFPDKIPGVRTVIVADPGYVFIECDYKQAELFVLAHLSQDKTYLDHLTTPGIDLHDIAAINAFNLQVYMGDGTPYDKKYMLDLALKNPEQFKKEQSKLTYKKPDGGVITRAEFKKTMRVGGKGINFGINYGRGARSIQINIHAETGIVVPIEALRHGINQWHKTYPSASKFLSNVRKMAVTKGYVENTLGRRRVWAKPQTEEQERSIEREAGNAIIQSTVAEVLKLAMVNVYKAKEKLNLGAKIVNPIHDALMLLVPEQEVEITKKVIKEEMSNIKIPLMDGSGHFTLDVDVETFFRWGE